MARHSANWSELYPELLTAIAGRLGTRDDVRHFRAVCKKWSSAVTEIPQNLPFLSPLFPFTFFYIPSVLIGSEDFDPFRFLDDSLVMVANTTFLLQSRQNPNPNHSKPWLITVEELNPGKLSLRIPLMRFLINKLPVSSLFNSINFPRVLDLSDCSVKEISRAYYLRYDVDDESFSWVDHDMNFNNKVVVFFDPASVSPTLYDCYALVLHNQGRLACWRLKDKQDSKKHADEMPACLQYGRTSRFDDIVIYRGGVWCIDRKGRVYVVHYSDALKMVMFSDDAICKGHMGNTRKRLVESPVGLFLIDRYHDNQLIRFRVYKLNEEEHKWSEVKSLDGRILFVSTDSCFFLSAEDFPMCGGNCIFFPMDHFPTYQNSTYPDEYYFSGARQKLKIGVFHLDNGESAIVSTYPGYSDIFWPPPKWLFRDTC